MINIKYHAVGISPKSLIQKLVDLVGIDNGQIVIKVQNKTFVHLQLQPSFKPDELDNTEIDENDKKTEKI